MGLVRMENTLVLTPPSAASSQVDGISTPIIYWYTPCNAISAPRATSRLTSTRACLLFSSRLLATKNHNIYSTYTRTPSTATPSWGERTRNRKTTTARKSSIGTSTGVMR